MRTRNFLKIWLFCFIMLFFSIETAAQTLTVVFEEWPPYQFTSNSKVVGTDTEILEEAGRRLGITFQFKSVPWALALKEVQDGGVDAIFSLGITEERAKFLYYPDTPINMMRIVFFALKESSVRVSNLQDLKGLKVGIVRGNFYGKDFDAAQGFERISCTDHQQQFKMLLAKRFDLLISYDLVGMSVAKDLGLLDRVNMLEYVGTEQPLYVGFSKAKGAQAQTWTTEFSRIFKQLKDEGFIEAVLQKYRQ